MINTEVLIIGGGPAGSSCAWRLRQKGIDCLVLDRQRFPRVKVCAGWVTPQVLKEIQFQPQEYPGSFTTFRSFQVSLRGFRFTMPTVQHAIRRYEFDHWLLQRSGAPVTEHAVKSITLQQGNYVVDQEYSAKYLVGAGGTHCPVNRAFFQENRRDAFSLIVAQEEEFAYQATDSRCYLWFLEHQLPGYAWYVPKANGFVNVGVGGQEERLKANGDNLKRHWNLLVEKLETSGLIRGHTFRPAGHSYYVRQRAAQARRDNAFLAGDSAGLATLDMGEGIGPAVQSGILAAEAIIHGKDYSLHSIPRYSLGSLLRLR